MPQFGLGLSTASARHVLRLPACGTAPGGTLRVLTVDLVFFSYFICRHICACVCACVCASTHSFEKEWSGAALSMPWAQKDLQHPEGSVDCVDFSSHTSPCKSETVLFLPPVPVVCAFSSAICQAPRAPETQS